MKLISHLICVLFIQLVLATNTNSQHRNNSLSTAVVIDNGLVADKLSDSWLSAISNRVSKQVYDSMHLLQRPYSKEELEWELLIRSRAAYWNSIRDSLQVPFVDITLQDTIHVLLGGFGGDDAFTYRGNTVCFDPTALVTAYGSALQAINTNRMDRIFAHEFTHLIHKQWLIKHEFKLNNFRDSILWECLYEGIGMYRSMGEKWLPKNGVVPEPTVAALKQLIPVFVSRIKSINSDTAFTGDEKKALHAGLSRGPVDKKWGAFPVAIWLALEAGGDDRKLRRWMEMGLKGVLELAEKWVKK